METGNETYYFGEYGSFGCYCNDGVVYKDRQAFESGKGVCYIPEYGFDNENENVAPLELEGNSYMATDGYTKEDLESLCRGTGFDVEDFFNHLDWMYPETLMDEWIREEEDA